MRPRGIPVPLVISRAESLAIADAMTQAVRRPAGSGHARDPAVFASSAGHRRRVRPAPAPADDAQRSAAAHGGTALLPPAFSGRQQPVRARGGGRRANRCRPCGHRCGSTRQCGDRSGVAGGMPASPTTTPGTQVQLGIERDQMFREVRRVFSDSMAVACRSMDSALTDLPRYVRVEMPKPGAMTVVPPGSQQRWPHACGQSAILQRHRQSGHDGVHAQPVEVAARGTAERPVRGDEPGMRWRNRPRARDRMAMGWMLRSDYVVSGMLRMRSDSLQLTTILTDVRGGHFCRHVETTVPMSESKRVMETDVGAGEPMARFARARSARRPWAAAAEAARCSGRGGP